MSLLNLATAGVAIAVLTFLLRALPSYLAKGFSADESFHLYLINEIRDNGHRVPETYARILPSTKVAYPPLLHWLLSFVPQETVERIGPYFGGITDGMQNLVVIFFAYWLFRSSQLSGEVPAVKAALLAGLVFAFTPRLVLGRPKTSRLRLSGRSLGGLFVTTSVFMALLWLQTETPVFLVASIIAVSATCLTSYYSTQTMWLLYPSLGVVTGNLSIPGILLAGHLLALIVYRKKYIRVLRAHLGLLYWYSSHKYREVKHWLGDLEPRIDTTLFDALHPARVMKGVFSNSVTGMYLQIPFIVFPFIFAAENQVSGAYLFLFAWIGFALVTNLITSIPAFIAKPADRYSEYIVAPLSIMTAATFFMVNSIEIWTLPVTTSFLLGLLFVYSVGVIGLNVAIDIIIQEKEGFDELVDWLKDRRPDITVSAIPGPLANRLLPVTPQTYVTSLNDMFATLEGREECREVFRGSVAPPNLAAINKKYDPDYLVIDASLSAHEFVVNEYGLDRLNKVADKGEFSVYDFE